MTESKTLISRLNDFGESFERQHSFYGSPFVKSMIERGGAYESPSSGTVYRIPTHFGFCYGVEKSIDLAFETTRRFPDRRIFLTHDVIHNDRVHRDLLAKGVRVLDRDPGNQLILKDIRSQDIVIIAAFGSKFHDVDALKAKGCVVVDTTCGAIVVVWKRVEKYAKAGHTALIHGIWDHEETQATASQALKFGGHFIIIRDMEDAAQIGAFLKGQLSSESFMGRFGQKASAGFRPERDLSKVGMASQTTMFKEETLGIQEYLKDLYAEVFGAERLAQTFLLYDTICSATQERQDALSALLALGPDLMLVIGGFNSSNTTHLSEIAAKQGPSFHIRGPEDILSASEIRNMCPSKLTERVSSGWLEKRPRLVGIATGASTPDLLIERVITRVEELLAS